jgi:hypothetical protein
MAPSRLARIAVSPGLSEIAPELFRLFEAIHMPAGPFRPI